MATEEEGDRGDRGGWQPLVGGRGASRRRSGTRLGFAIGLGTTIFLVGPRFSWAVSAYPAVSIRIGNVFPFLKAIITNTSRYVSRPYQGRTRTRYVSGY